MLIIIEGADCAGKSGLALRLAAVLDRRYQDRVTRPTQVLHAGPPTRHPLDEYVTPLLDYRPNSSHIICDRWHVGESVYPELVGRESQLTAGVRAWIELFLASRGALLVHLRRPAEYLANCARSRGDVANQDVETTRATVRAFDRELIGTLLPTLSLDDDPTDADLIEIAYMASQASTTCASARGSSVTYVGPSFPTLLLVGDRRGPRNGDVGRFAGWPAFAPYPTTSGAYLMDALTRRSLRVATDGTLLSTIAIANANDVDDIQQVWFDQGRPRVVALGVEANAKLRKLKVPVARSVPHPQYWRRFRHREHDAYLARILGREEPVRA